MALHCFTSSSVVPHLLDRASFKCAHTLTDHPSLQLDMLAQVIPQLPSRQVMYSIRKLGVDANFEKTFRERPNEPVERVIESLRTSNSYIMIQSPEVHPAFSDIYRQLVTDVSQLMDERGIKTAPLNPQLYLFIASPNSVTPFHLDRYSTLLLQVRGSKRVTVFPQWDERVVASQPLEDYVAYRSTALAWDSALDRLGQAYDFTPGEALHIPFAAGHHVANGADDVSVSLSIIFNTEETQRWNRALLFNCAARRRLARLGLEVSSVGGNTLRDSAKSLAWQSLERLRAHRASRRANPSG